MLSQANSMRPKRSNLKFIFTKKVLFMLYLNAYR